MLVTTEHRGEPGIVLRIVAAGHGFRGDDLPGVDFVAQALQPQRAEVAPLEEVADLPARVARHDDRIGTRDALQSRREIGRVTRDVERVRRDLSVQVADDDEAGRDSDAHLQPAIAEHPQRADPVDRRERGVDRALGVVLVRLGKAEEDELAVAEEAGNVAAELGHRARNPLMELREDRAVVLGIEPRSERRRSDEIAEGDGDLAAFEGRGSRRLSAPARGRRAIPRLDEPGAALRTEIRAGPRHETAAGTAACPWRAIGLRFPAPRAHGPFQPRVAFLPIPPALGKCCRARPLSAPRPPPTHPAAP